MQEMLRALDHRRSARFLGDIHQSLDAKKPRSKVLRDPVQQELRFFARERALPGEYEILDSPAFKVRLVRVARVIVFVMVMIVAARVMVLGGVLIGLNVKPRAGIGRRVGACRTPKT